MRGTRAKQIRRLHYDLTTNNPGMRFSYRRLKKQYTRDKYSMLHILKARYARR